MTTMQTNKIHPLLEQYVQSETRRQFFRQGGNALGLAALASLGVPNVGLGDEPIASASQLSAGTVSGGLGTLPHFAAKAKRAIYLHMVGGPSQMDLFDYKPQMNDWYDKDLPESIRNGQ